MNIIQQRNLELPHWERHWAAGAGAVRTRHTVPTPGGVGGRGGSLVTALYPREGATLRVWRPWGPKTSLLGGVPKKGQKPPKTPHFREN